MFFFIVGYALVRKDLYSFSEHLVYHPEAVRTYRAAALCSDVWQKWKRTSLSVFVKAYLPDMAMCCSQCLSIAAQVKVQ